MEFAKLQIILLPKESAQEIKLKSLSSISSFEHIDKKRMNSDEDSPGRTLINGLNF